MYYSFKRNNFDSGTSLLQSPPSIGSTSNIIITVIFFQQGTFFNLFGYDADISVKEFNFVYNTKLDSTGFGMGALEEWVAKFIGLGYSVMVIEQKSTAFTEVEKTAKKNSRAKTEERQITQRVSFGTYRDLDRIGDDARTRYVLIVMVWEQKIIFLNFKISKF